MSADAAREAAIAKSERDVVAQTKSGPWELSAEQAAANRKVFAAITDIVPIPDIHKISDCDLIYRFLIAKRWNIEQTIDGLRKYVEFRVANKIDTILWEPFPEELEHLFTFRGLDLAGRPIAYNRPDPAFVSRMMEKHPREFLIRHQIKCVERGRRTCLSLGVDRMTTITDLSMLGLSIVSNMSAMGLLKEASTLVQTHFPENAAVILICNGGWVFSALFALMKAFLDERVQKKFVNCGSGTDASAELAKLIDLNMVPASYGGKGPEQPPRFRALAEVDTAPPGSTLLLGAGAYKAAPFADGPASPLVQANPEAVAAALRENGITATGATAAAATPAA
jgi:hypothetical protein